MNLRWYLSSSKSFRFITFLYCYFVSVKWKTSWFLSNATTGSATSVSRVIAIALVREVSKKCKHAKEVLCLTLPEKKITLYCGSLRYHYNVNLILVDSNILLLLFIDSKQCVRWNFTYSSIDPIKLFMGTLLYYSLWKYGVNLLIKEEVHVFFIGKTHLIFDQSILLMNISSNGK